MNRPWVGFGLALALVVTLVVIAATVEGDREPAVYVALGDSYTSAPYVPDYSEDDPCLRSSRNYPSLVAEEANVDLFDRSCGGATTDNMTVEQVLPQGDRVDPQFDALSDEVDLVTVGIGANDFGLFTSLVYACYPDVRDGKPCHEDSLQGEELDQVLTAIETSVGRVLAGVAERAPNAEIVTVPYPQMFPPQPCLERLSFGEEDLAYMRDVNQRLSDILTDAADAAGARTIDVYGASEGHDTCAEDTWIKDERTDTKVAASFHPLAEHQAAVSEMLLEELCDDVLDC